MRWAKTERKKILFRIPFLLDPGKKIPKKNSRKIQKIKKVNSRVISIRNGLREVEKERKKI